MEHSLSNTRNPSWVSYSIPCYRNCPVVLQYTRYESLCRSRLPCCLQSLTTWTAAGAWEMPCVPIESTHTQYTLNPIFDCMPFNTPLHYVVSHYGVLHRQEVFPLCATRRCFFSETQQKQQSLVNKCCCCSLST